MELYLDIVDWILDGSHGFHPLVHKLYVIPLRMARAF